MALISDRRGTAVCNSLVFPDFHKARVQWYVDRGVNNVSLDPEAGITMARNGWSTVSEWKLE